MKTSKCIPLKKKRKVDQAFKPPAPAPSLDLTDSSQQQEDSTLLQTPVKPNGSKLDAILEVAETQSFSDDESTENSYEVQEAMLREEDLMRAFREEAQAWLLDHGKAFFHVEALAFLRDQERKKAKADPQPIPSSSGFLHSRRK